MPSEKRKYIRRSNFKKIDKLLAKLKATTYYSDGSKTSALKPFKKMFDYGLGSEIKKVKDQLDH